uniref:Esterase/lipase/thioesterase n=1 Tax=Zea mays TaxID=4577 RepID=B6U688_MAIZE|nr:esterase/lipase/thioesterase [Zea mays]|eukprot:NP_001151903.1 esterase/lipase/thioesterase [Zea mays]
MGAVTSTVAARFAFFPPSPPSYGFEQPAPLPAPATPEPPAPATSKPPPPAPATPKPPPAGEEKGGGAVVELTGVPRRVNVEARRLRTKLGTEVVAMHVRQAGAKLTLLYSHGNAADLGQMYELFVELSAHLNVNLMGYDYSGYGQSTGKPSEQNTYSDIEAVYRCLIETYGASEDNIILYGQSVGSGPTLDLASRLTRLRAVVLHSPILSGLRVMYPVKHTYWFDIYKNIDKIPLVRCPVLVIHGTADEVVDCSHGRSLWELAEVKYEPLWIKGGNHCNLELYPEYIKHLKKFVGAIEKSPPPPPIDECMESSGPSDCTPAEPECTADSRKSTDCRDKARPSIDQRQSTDRRDKPRGSTDRRDKTRKSVDHPEKPRASVDQPDRPRKSIDRFGGMMKSVRLCNIDCFKVTATSGS